MKKYVMMMAMIVNLKQFRNGQFVAATMISGHTFAMFTALILAWTHFQCLLPWYLLGHIFNAYCPDTCLDTFSMLTALILAWTHFQCLLPWYLLGHISNAYCPDTCLDTFSMLTAVVLAPTSREHIILENKYHCEVSSFFFENYLRMWFGIIFRSKKWNVCPSTV